MHRKKLLFKSLLLFALLGASVFFMSSCGGGVTAPPDATITIKPESFTPPPDGSAESSWHTQFFTIYVENSKGDLLGDIEIWISYPWAVPDSAGVVQLYDGNTPKNSPFMAKTDDDGVYQLRFDYQSGGGLKYKGDLEVRSGSAFKTAAFEVTSQ